MHDRNDSKSEHTNALNIVFKVQPTSFIASTRSLSSVSYPECFIIVRNFENLTQTRALFLAPSLTTDLLFIQLLLWYPATNLKISVAADKYIYFRLRYSHCPRIKMLSLKGIRYNKPSLLSKL